MSEALSHDVRYQQIGCERFCQGFVDHAATRSFATGYADTYRVKDDGIDNSVPRDSGILGATSVRTFCEQVLRPMIAG